MSRRRPSRTDDVVHSYWPHSDPEPSRGDNRANIIRAEVTSDDEPCPGPCNTAFRRAELDGPDHDIPFHPGRPVWCVNVHAFNARGELLDKLDHHGCTTTILQRLYDLPALAAVLAPGRISTPRDADIDHGNTTHGGARSLAHAPSPSPAWDTADELIRWALRLEDTLRHRLDQPATPHAYRTLTEAVAYLRRNGETLLAGPGAARIGQDILDTHRRLERLVGHDRLVHRIQEPCPRCGRKGMRRKDGDELVSCRSCNAVWDWDHFQLLSRAYAETVTAKGSA